MPPPPLNNICILTWHLSHCQIFEHLMCANFVKLLLIVDHMWCWWWGGWWGITYNIRTDFELVIMTRSIIRSCPKGRHTHAPIVRHGNSHHYYPRLLTAIRFRVKSNHGDPLLLTRLILQKITISMVMFGMDSKTIYHINYTPWKWGGGCAIPFVRFENGVSH